MPSAAIARGGPLDGQFIVISQQPRNGQQHKASNDNYYKFHEASREWLFCVTQYSPARLNAPR